MAPGPTGWDFWSGQVPVPLGISTVQFTATDNQNSIQTNALVQVALKADLLDITATSYLQALVDFGTEPFMAGQPRVLIGGSGALTTSTIDSTFYRSVALLLGNDYPERANEAVYPARICVEVLRKYLAQNAPTTSQATALTAAQAAYQQAAYLSLLQHIGTSYDEIRLARTYNRQDPQGLANAQALADRLGIEVGPNTDPDLGYVGDHLDRLCFAPQGTPDSTFVFQLTATSAPRPGVPAATATATVNIVVYGTYPPITLSAGKNQTVNHGATVSLSASGVDSIPGTSFIAYQWTQTAGPPVSLNNLSTATANFVAPAVTSDTLFTFQIVVTDNRGATASSTVTVMVNAQLERMILDAGDSQTVYQGVHVNLNGSADDDTATYQWTQISGPPVELTNATSATAGFASPLAAHPIGLLNEQNVEQTFGLPDSTRDPFSQGPTIGDTQGLITRWSLPGLRWNHPFGTDPEGMVYLEISFGNPTQVELYQDKGKTNPLATGTGNTPGEVTLSASNNSGVSGRVAINAKGQDALIGLSVFPRFLSWQRQDLRRVWQQEDFQFSQGAIVGDSQAQIVSCNLTGVHPGQRGNTDTLGIIYVSLRQTAGPVYQVLLYQDAGRTYLVASGASSAASGPVTLVPDNSSGLSGSVTINYKADSTQISIPFVYTTPPIIDPDVLNPGDFKDSYASVVLFPGRQATIQGWIREFTAAGGTLAGLNTILQRVLIDLKYYPQGMQVSDLLALNRLAQDGTDISAQLTALRLELDAFNYLVQVCPIQQSGIPLLDSEWDDTYSILAQVLKLRSYTAWSIEEANVQLTLGPDYFNYPPSLPALPNTGVDATGLPISDGSTDPRWTLLSTPSSSTAALAYVTDDHYPLGLDWIANDSNSRWISPQADESGNVNQGDAPGFYTYQTILDLTGYDPASVALTLQLAVDDELAAIRVNGNALGVTATSYSGFTTLKIAGPFQSGANTLNFVVYNAGTRANPSGLRVAFSCSSPPSLAVLPRWRATIQQRKVWQNSLKARIDQDDSLVTGLQAAVDQTEHQTLLPLRNALAAAAATEASVPSLYSTGVKSARLPPQTPRFSTFNGALPPYPAGLPTPSLSSQKGRRPRGYRMILGAFGSAPLPRKRRDRLMRWVITHTIRASIWVPSTLPRSRSG
jgi:hypothetical protein